ncbi:hypothetical protein V493_01484, partial [Pseudogymnoascus sp. VKM F-4281 (FW-2241)]
MDSNIPASPYPPVGGHETDPTTSAIATTPLSAPTAATIPADGTLTTISPPSHPASPIAILSDSGGPPWPRPPTPGPGPSL